MKDNKYIFIKESSIFNMFISAVIAIFIGAVYMTIKAYGFEITIDFLKIAGIGMGISAIAEFIFYLMDEYFPTNIIFSFIGVFIIILIGTIVASMLMGVKEFMGVLLLAAGAEIVGMSFTYFNYRYQSNKLNQKLKDKKIQVKNRLNKY
ncbi:MAG: hypothetical protein ACOCRZ_02890 [Halothermotrichaceae bacterium]